MNARERWNRWLAAVAALLSLRQIARHTPAACAFF